MNNAILLLMFFLISGCASKQSGVDVVTTSRIITIEVPKKEISSISDNFTLDDKNVIFLVEKYGSHKMDFEVKVPPEELGAWNCLVIVPDDGFITNEELSKMEHITFKIVGEVNKWIPINGKAKRYVIVKVVN